MGSRIFFFFLHSPLCYDRGVNGQFLLEKPLGLFFESTWAGCKHANEEVRQPGRKKKKKVSLASPQQLTSTRRTSAIKLRPTAH